jgi:hypothetical protein
MSVRENGNLVQFVRGLRSWGNLFECHLLLLGSKHTVHDSSSSHSATQHHPSADYQWSLAAGVERQRNHHVLLCGTKSQQKLVSPTTTFHTVEESFLRVSSCGGVSQELSVFGCKVKGGGMGFAGQQGVF